MLQKFELSKLQSLFAVYQLQTANGLVLDYHEEWKQDENGNFLKVRVPDSHDSYQNNNNNQNSGGCDDCCGGCNDCCNICNNRCVDCWNCCACCNNTIVCCRCCI